MDKKNAKLKNNITQMIGQLSKIYKEISSKENDSYLLGKKEAFEEILNWFLQTHNGDFRYVSANNFFNMIQEKLNKVKISINKQNEEAEEEILNIKDFRDLKQINFSDLKINDNRKRINRFAQDQSVNEGVKMQENSNTNNIQFSLINPFLTYSNQSNNQGFILNLSNSSGCTNNNSNNSHVLNSNSSVVNSGFAVPANNFSPNNNGTFDNTQGNSFGLGAAIGSRGQNPFFPISNNSTNNNTGFSLLNTSASLSALNNSVSNSSGNSNNNVFNLNQVNHQGNYSSNSNSNNSSLSKRKRK